MQISVLLGGESSERPVSLVSGLAVGRACLGLGHDVRFLDPATGAEERVTPGGEAPDLSVSWAAHTPDPARIPSNLERLCKPRPDAVLNLLHGGAGEGGTVQAILDLFALPYAGSGHVASAVAMDKVVAKRVLERLAIPVAAELLWRANRTGAITPPSDEQLAPLGGYPVIAKPISGGSTVGVTLVKDASMWADAWRNAGQEIDRERGILLEHFVPGKELTVGIFEDRPLPVVEIRPREGFYDFRNKYTAGQTDYLVPAEIDAKDATRLQGWALAAYRAIGCRDLARVDFRLSPDGEVACLELNTIPGMTPTSLLPKAARAVGIEFQDLVARLIARAVERGGAPAPAARGADR
ncbi:MAG: D-alanine--D-alanine ligase [Candidatus Eisenbacteria bacterium]